MQDRRRFFLHRFARLKPGINPPKPSPALPASAPQSSRNTVKRFTLHPASHGNLSNQKDIVTVMWLLSALVAGVLLIACANNANLLPALGASRWNLSSPPFAPS